MKRFARVLGYVAAAVLIAGCGTPESDVSATAHQQAVNTDSSSAGALTANKAAPLGINNTKTDTLSEERPECPRGQNSCIDGCTGESFCVRAGKCPAGHTYCPY